MDPHAVVAARWRSSACICRFRRATSWPGLADIGPLLVVAVPLGIYNFTEGMNNVESASAAGDKFNLRKVLLADGIGALAGAVLGSPFPPAVYIGHPGWKSVGGRIGYSMATGVVIALVCFLGLAALLLAVVPLVVDPADTSVYRPGDRRAGVRGDAGPSRAGGDPGHAAEHRLLGAEPDRRRACTRRAPRRRRSGSTSWRATA